jgi:intein/homing endonuclease
MNLSQNCLRCKHYMRCKDPAKSIIYTCDRWDTNQQALQQEAAILSDLTEQPFAVHGVEQKLALPSEPGALYGGVNAHELIKSIIKDKRIVSPDIRIPEGDFQKAPNFYKWCVSDKFLNQKPFVMQALIATKLFAEYCPDCSDTEWMEHGAKVDDSLGRFERKVALLEHGECPHCGTNRLKLYKQKKLSLYIELALNAGQRCVTADTLVLTEDGIVEIGDYVGNRPYGFSDLGVKFHTGDTGLQTATRFYRARAEHCIRLETKAGFSITGTKDHPVMTLDGFKRLGVVSTHEYVRVYYGQQVFGNKSVILRDITEKTNLQYDQWRAMLTPIARSNTVKPRRKPGLGKHNIYELNEALARVLGYWVAEGRYRGIANDDPMVLSDVYSTLDSMFGDVIHLERRGVSFTNKYVQMWLGNLMSVDIYGKSARKEVPRCILQASKAVQTAFLSALFEGDGSARDKREGSTKYGVSYGSISKKLVDQLSVMLLNLGIPHRRRVKKTWATNGSAKQVEKDCYCLAIRGPALEVFEREIGFRSERKKAKLASAVEFVQNRTNIVPCDYEKLPVPMSDQFLIAMDEVQAQLNQLPNRGVTGSCFGLASIFPGHRAFLRAGRQRTVTKDDVQRFVPTLLSGEFEFNEVLTGKLRGFLEFADSSYYYDKVSSIGQTKEKLETFDVTVPGRHRFLSNGLLSHNSGKSALLGMMFTYMTHRLLKLERPNEVYGLLSSTVLQATFVALTFAQAKDTLYDPFYGNVLSSPWFQEYHEMLNSIERRHGENELYNLKDTFVHYRHRRLMIYPAGPDKRILRGRTRFGAAIDELGWFPNDADAKKNVKMNADEVYTALDNSLATVAGAARSMIKRGFFDVPPSYFLNISSPSSVRDKICELVRKAMGSRYTLGLQRSTWEMNPTLPKKCSFIKKKFKDNPVDAMRDFGAQPPLTNSPFLSNHDSLAACFGRSNYIKIAIKFHKLTNGSKEIYGELVDIRPSGRPEALALDAGYSFNSFAFALGYLDDANNPVISVVGEVAPMPGMPLNYTFMYRALIAQLCAKRNIVMCAADRWNSLKILSDLEVDFGVAKKQYSLKYQDMQLFKSYVTDGQILVPKPKRSIAEILAYNQGDYPECFKDKPEEHQVLQLLTVQDTGSAVIKGDRLTDDIVRAEMLCFSQLIDPDNAELLHKPVKEQIMRIDISKMAVLRGYSGGGGGASSGGGGGQSNIGFIRQKG